MKAQLIAALFMAILGIAGSVLADWKKALSLCCRWNGRQQAAADFCYCLLCGLIFWQYLLQLNGGLFRNYIIFGLLAGVVGYYLLLHRRLFPVWLWLVRTLVGVFRFLAKWIGRIVRVPLRICNRYMLRPIKKRVTIYLAKQRALRQQEEEPPFSS